MAFGDRLKSLWGAVTPWQSNWEADQGISGKWGDASYKQGGAGYNVNQRNPWSYLIPGAGVWAAGIDAANDVFGPSQEDRAAAEALQDIDFQGIAEDARDSAYSTYGIEFDEEGNRITPTASALNTQAQEMSEDLPTFTEWLAEQGIELGDTEGVQAGLEGLIDQLEAGPTDEDYDAAMAHAARLMGLSREEAESIMGDLTNQMTEGIAGVEGMSPEEEALRRRQNQSNIRMAEQRAQRLVQDSLADTGSTARMLQTADEATMQINNMQLQQDAMLAQEQFERQFAQFESQKQTWQTMLQTNQIGSQQYIQNMQNSMGIAIQGYATQIDAIMAQNETYLNQYGADFQALQTQVENLYTAAQVQMGVDQAAIDAMTSLYESAIAPFMDSIEAMIASGELEAFDWAGFLSSVTDVAGIAIGASGGAA